MSIKIMTRVWEAPFPTPAMKLVALKLADCANDDGENIYPSVPRVSRETGVSESAIRATIADLEASGLLVLLEQLSGNRIGRSTAVRRFDLDRLKALAEGAIGWRHESVPVIDSKTGAVKTTAAGEVKTREVWRLGALDEEPAAPPTSGGVPLQRQEGYPSGDWTPPLQRQEGYPSGDWTPLYTDEPSREPSDEPSLPPSPHGEGEGVRFARGWSDTARSAVADLARSATRAHVASALIAAVAGTLNPPAHADAAAYVRQLGAKLGAFPAEVLAAVAEALVETRKRDLPAVADLVALANAAARSVRERQSRPVVVPSAAADVDLAVAARRDELLAAAEARLGGDVVRCWLAGIALNRIEAGVLEAAFVVPFVARYVDSHYAEALLGAARALWPDLGAVRITTRRDIGRAAA